MPVACPRSKVAVVMRAYNKTPKCTWCPEPEAWWCHESNASHVQVLEELLRFWQVTLRPAVLAAAKRSEKKEGFVSETVANVCTLGAESLLRNHKEELAVERKKALLLAARDVYKQVRDECPAEVWDKISYEGSPGWIDYAGLDSDSQPCAAVAG